MLQCLQFYQKYLNISTTKSFSLHAKGFGKSLNRNCGTPRALACVSPACTSQKPATNWLHWFVSFEVHSVTFFRTGLPFPDIFRGLFPRWVYEWNPADVENIWEAFEKIYSFMWRQAPFLDKSPVCIEIFFFFKNLYICVNVALVIKLFIMTTGFGIGNEAWFRFAPAELHLCVFEKAMRWEAGPLKLNSSTVNHGLR